MTAKMTTRIYKDDDFNTVGISMELRNSEDLTTMSLLSGYVSRPGLYIKETTADYYTQFVELNNLFEKKDTLKKFESRFFDIAVKALGEKALDGVGFDFSTIRKEIEDCEARIGEIINSIR